MRKLLIVFTAFIVLTVSLIVSAYILLPRESSIFQETTIKASQYSIFRYLSDQSKWGKWWPVENTTKGGLKEYESYKGYSFKITKLLYNALEVQVKNKDLASDGKIVMIPIANDSILIHWQQLLVAESNLFSRFQKYRKGKELQQSMRLILDSLKTFNEDKKRVYRFNIHHVTLQDTSLVATKRTTKDYPSVENIYNWIGYLKKYVATEGAIETNYPMLNITKTADNRYATMVALPTNKTLSGRGDILFKRLIIYKDRVLSADVKGGPETIQQAYNELNTYMSDYKLDVPVIHFEYLITDRSKEPDTSKWVTKIYFPII